MFIFEYSESSFSENRRRKNCIESGVKKILSSQDRQTATKWAWNGLISWSLGQSWLAFFCCYCALSMLATICAERRTTTTTETVLLIITSKYHIIYWIWKMFQSFRIYLVPTSRHRSGGYEYSLTPSGRKWIQLGTDYRVFTKKNHFLFPRSNRFRERHSFHSRETVSVLKGGLIGLRTRLIYISCTV